MSKKKGKVVTLRTKRDRKQYKKISDEPEMKELKRMIKDGEIDRNRTLEHLRKEAKKETILSGTPVENETGHDQEEDTS